MYNNTSPDTIAAIATARGEGGIAIVRISGEKAGEILSSMFRPAVKRGKYESHRMMYGRAVDFEGETLDEVMAVMMRAPYTYTREDVAEIHCHGGRLCASAVLSRALELGARMAEPGEFTRRAFMNGRIDLTRAEAVMQLIGANAQAAARASLRQLEGGVSGFVKKASDDITGILAMIEAATDFPEEVEEEAAAERIVSELSTVIADIRARCDVRHARLLREGASIVLAGRPNVGKSSLMNALLNQERAIVTDIPGTTRDVLTERVSFGGVLAELSDTAGQRDTSDPIEKIGVDRARRATESADVLLIVVDAAEPLTSEDEALIRGADGRAIICLNKTDLTPAVTRGMIEAMTGATICELSAQKGWGMDALIGEITRRIASGDEQDGMLMAQRHIELAQRAADLLQSGVDAIRSGMPLDTAAIDLREAMAVLGQITGQDVTEEVIDRVFSTFCVGK